MTIVQECGYEPPHQHEFPDDWTFGGADGEDPRADVRWTPTTYVYLNDHFDEVWRTQTPLCDDEALDEFTKHAALGATYLQARQPDGELVLLDWQYDPKTDVLSPLGR